MDDKHYSLLNLLVEKQTGTLLDNHTQRLPINGMQVLSYLWPLNQCFKNRFHQIKTVRYRKQFEREADTAIKNFIFHDSDWSEYPLIVWRILLERLIQSHILCIANEKANNTVMYMPTGLSPSAKTKFSVLFLMYKMKLPYPVSNETTFDIDAVFPETTDNLH
ncbi:hypothetical protein EKN56_05950 [Limnobaculum zhutongyuii]|uniref:Uncharacterized protein n=1 Tax=Limnobaculum zhutongyuii TaxID=2498113 RepID=A0A411WIG9_9GAMM|nr:hypothetical protein [Limnobaculum zhutongyuii]QBH95983.1 hypothetical protein EKN56_05950 [Limnobaculum zhutongyuii]TQS89306.1 hypothetical protein ELQ32_05970 [Limnobaculum zhutongyuii]